MEMVGDGLDDGLMTDICLSIDFLQSRFRYINQFALIVDIAIVVVFKRRFHNNSSSI